MLDFARRGRGRCAPFSPAKHAFSREWLNADQRRAVEHVLSTTDRVMLIRGADSPFGGAQANTVLGEIRRPCERGACMFLATTRRRGFSWLNMERALRDA